MPDHPNVQFRGMTQHDLPFLFHLYASTREDELSVVPWTDAQKHDFLSMQFEAQHRYYQENYSDAQFDVIVIDGTLAGRLYLQRREKEHRIIDIALLPEFRGKGIGGRILNDLLQNAAGEGKRALGAALQFP